MSAQNQQNQQQAIKPATPLPWEIEPSPHGGAILVRPGSPQSHVQLYDAAYIVAACNAYPELVAALRNIIEPDSDGFTILSQGNKDAQRIRALLAKLGEGV
jgi:hypothetical protein